MLTPFPRVTEVSKVTDNKQTGFLAAVGRATNPEEWDGGAVAVVGWRQTPEHEYPHIYTYTQIHDIYIYIYIYTCFVCISCS